MTAPYETPSSAAARALPPELSPRQQRRHQRRTGVVLLTAVACLGSSGILATAAAGYAGLRYTDAKVARVSNVIVHNKHTPKKVVSKAQNILIVGSDSRKGLTRNQQAALHVGSEKTAEGQRSDVMMLLHISAGAKKAEIMSFPRDTWVAIPEHTENGKVVPERHAKINEAFHGGGGALAVQTVENLTGIRIDHYVEVNFLGFVTMVQAVGGVEVCSPRALKDKDSGLNIKAGVTQLDAQTALKYARARHVDSDFGRIGRQQKLIAAIMRKATSTGVLTNPRTLSHLVSAALSAVTVDNTFSDGDFVDLAKHMSSLSPKNLVFVTLPVADDNYHPPQLPAASAVQLDETASQEIYNKFIHDEEVGPQASPRASASPTATTPPLTRSPGSVRVRVLNGSGVVGLGKKAATDLADVGFAVAGPARNATTTGATVTTIRADPTYTESVKTLQAAQPGAVVEQVPGLGRTFQVVVGSTYTGATKVVVTGTRTPTASPSASPSIATRTADDASCT